MIKIGKDYKVFRSDHKFTKDNKPYTMFDISDNKKDETEPSGWRSTYFTVMYWDSLDIEKGDMVVLKNIVGVEVSEYNKNGKIYKRNTISSDNVEVKSNIRQVANNSDGTTPFDANNMDLPF